MPASNENSLQGVFFVEKKSVKKAKVERKELVYLKNPFLKFWRGNLIKNHDLSENLIINVTNFVDKNRSFN